MSTNEEIVVTLRRIGGVVATEAADRIISLENMNEVLRTAFINQRNEKRKTDMYVAALEGIVRDLIRKDKER